jgi:hypothetical protein
MNNRRSETQAESPKRSRATWVITVAVLFLVVHFSAGSVRGAIVQWQIADGGNGHYYALVGDYADPMQRWSWETSKLMAESMTHLGMQGHLVTISSEAENQFLADTFYPGPDEPWPTWIGLTDNEAYGGFESSNQLNPEIDGWVWVTGEPLVYTNWTPGNPDNLNDEDFALMGSQHRDHHMWNDQQSGTGGHAPFFVEFEPVPEPSSFVAWLLLGMISFRGCAALRSSWLRVR